MKSLLTKGFLATVVLVPGVAQLSVQEDAHAATSTQIQNQKRQIEGQIQKLKNDVENHGRYIREQNFKYSEKVRYINNERQKELSELKSYADRDRQEVKKPFNEERARILQQAKTELAKLKADTRIPAAQKVRYEGKITEEKTVKLQRLEQKLAEKLKLVADRETVYKNKINAKYNERIAREKMDLDRKLIDPKSRIAGLNAQIIALQTQLKKLG